VGLIISRDLRNYRNWSGSWNSSGHRKFSLFWWLVMILSFSIWHRTI